MVGSGTAGAYAAQHLSQHTTKVTLIGEEEFAPYSRPKLSKSYLQGAISAKDLLMRSRQDWASTGVDLRLGTKAALVDTDERAVFLSDGARVNYDRLLIATGSKPIGIPIPNEAGIPVLTLRTVLDADEILNVANHVEYALVVGSSFNGLEVAASLRSRNLSTTVVSLDAFPLEGRYGPVLGGAIARRLDEHDIEVLYRDTVERIQAGADGTFAVLRSGARRRCDLVVVCVGAQPRISLAAESGLRLEGSGVWCDSQLRTSVDGVFVAGDIASYPSLALGRWTRMDRWEAAYRQGTTAASNMLGSNIEYDDRTAYFHSELADWLAIEGYGVNTPECDEVVIAGDPATGPALIHYFRDDGIRAAVSIDHEVVDEMDIARLQASSPVLSRL